ncbi:MAG: FmdB family zinc ribbon protein [Vicinamibacterales bacterium]
MPIFEYACRACGQQFEILVRKGDTPACPACAGQDLEKLLSDVAIKSSGTHALALKAAKRRDAKQGAENARAQREYELSHND